jgi:CHAT domain-containing protein
MLTADCVESVFLSISTSGKAYEMPFQSFRLRELGAEVEYSHDGKNWLPIALPATRVGIHTEVKRAKPIWLKSSAKKSAQIEIARICNLSDAALKWELSLQKIAEATDYTHKTDNDLLRSSAISLSLQLDSSKSLEHKAYASHLAANQLWLVGDLEASEKLFLRAAEMWATLERPELKAAADLGAFELAFRAKRLTVPQVKDWSFGEFKGNTYFQLRVQDLICLIESEEGNYQRAQTCLSEVIRGYEIIDETFDALNSRINQIYWLKPLDALSVDTASIKDIADKLPDIPNSHLYRGRYYLAMEHLLRLKGDLFSAIRYNLKAQSEFALSPEETEAWQVTSNRTRAKTLTQLGLHEQALVLLKTTLDQVDAKYYPARALSVIDQLSQTFESAARIPEAIQWQEAALRLRENLGLKAEAAVSRHRLQWLDSKRTNYRLFDETLPLAFQTDEKLLEVSMLIEQDKLVSAKAKLKQIEVLTLSSLQEETAVRLGARLDIKQAQPRQASDRLAKFFESRVDALSSQQSGALAYLELRRLQALSRMWIDAQQSQAKSSNKQNIGHMWTFGLLQNASRQLTPSIIEPKIAAVPKDFTDWLAQSSLSTRIVSKHVVSLAKLQSQLPPDATVLMLLPGDQKSVVLWINQTSVETAELAGFSDLQKLITSSNQLLQQKAPPVRISALRKDFRGWFPPSMSTKLWIVADELSLSVPFAAILPEDARIDEISFLTGLRTSSKSEANAEGNQDQTKRRHFFAPAQSNTSSSNLEFIERERQALARWEMQNFTGTSVTRENIRSALRNQGWTHVAAHGKANSSEFGLAGFQLATDGGDYLSWLELSQMPIKNELLVLNACDLASATQAGRQANVSFALAASSAGAKHTIASVWPISDAASATWVPTFYKALNSDADNAGLALYKAQRALAASPHFRHPYYWASLVHFRQFVLEAD